MSSTYIIRAWWSAQPPLRRRVIVITSCIAIIYIVYVVQERVFLVPAVRLLGLVLVVLVLWVAINRVISIHEYPAVARVMARLWPAPKFVYLLALYDLVNFTQSAQYDRSNWSNLSIVFSEGTYRELTKKFSERELSDQAVSVWRESASSGQRAGIAGRNPLIRVGKSPDLKDGKWRIDKWGIGAEASPKKTTKPYKFEEPPEGPTIDLSAASNQPTIHLARVAERQPTDSQIDSITVALRQDSPRLGIRTGEDDRFTSKMYAVIGRGARCDIHIEGYVTISRSHASLAFDGESWWVTAIPPAKILVNSLPPRGRQRVRLNDRISWGSTEASPSSTIVFLSP